MRAILLSFIIIRIGEAANPGPSSEESEATSPSLGLTIGAVNPCGIMRKAASFQQLPHRHKVLWGICETHLTKPGIRKFRTELQCSIPDMRFHPGAPTPFRSASQSAIAGTHQGTGFLTNMPSRRLQATWSETEWATSRFVINTFLCDNVWLHGATIYGIANQAETQRVKTQTNELLSIATKRIVDSMTGLRFICGDFNQEQDLPEVEYWKRQGWREVQDIRQRMTGHPIEPTCKQTTRKDFLWISPELQPYFHSLDIVPHVFPDHSAICAHFLPFGKPSKVHHWHQPLPLPWDQLRGSLPSKDFQLDISASPEDQCKQIGHTLEQRLQEQLQQQGSRNLLPCEQGRCATLHTKSFVPHSKPLKPSRQGDAAPEYPGTSYQHQRWFTQLRRLESLNRLMAKESWTLQQDIHANREWRAVLRAAGFPAGFPNWWYQLQDKMPEAPAILSDALPSRPQMRAIVLTVEREVRTYERTLLQAFTTKAKNNRANNPRRIFKDVGKPLANPVQILDHSKAATVIAVDENDSSMILDKNPAFEPGLMSSDQGTFEPIHCCEDQLWVDPADLLPIGSAVRQECLIGNLDDLFAQFEKEWSQRWDRHRNLPANYWDELVTFFTRAIPKQTPASLPPITYEVWIQAVKRKKARAATGPDGLSRQDLLNMPRDLTEAMLDMLARIEKGKMLWPKQWMRGHVHLLEKIPDAAKCSQFRPITLFALPYRVWASIRTTQALHILLEHIPYQCFGSIPQRSATHMWLKLQHLIEDAMHFDQPLSGGVADIQKCFNHLPRLPVFTALIQLGMSHEVIRAWAVGLNQMQRHFSIRQSKGPGIKSSTGFAEGCPLSIIAMVGVNVMIDLWVRAREPTCIFWSYIDNHEVTASSPDATIRAVQALEKILAILDLPVDKDKSYVWANNYEGRKLFTESNLHVVRSCRDLGGQMQYTRKCSNRVIIDKIDSFKPRWKDLNLSLAPYSQKLQALKVVAWSNVLSGISSTHVGPKHFDGLRTQAMRALKEHSAGTSPLVHLSLVEHPSHDPQYMALLTSVMQVRHCLSRDETVPLLNSLASAPPKTYWKPKPGPISVLFERLQNVHWHWSFQGHFETETGEWVDLWDSPVQHLKHLLQEAWQQTACQTASMRKSFQGMHMTNAKFTTENLTKIPKDAALLRAAMNGTFFTGDHLQHRDISADGACALCGAPDSIHHRNWECPCLQNSRTFLSTTQTAEVLQMTPATTNHGWFPLPEQVQCLRAQLMQIDPNPPLEDIRIHSNSDHIHYFTDGACVDPADPYVRICAWGVIARTSSDLHTSQPVGHGILAGSFQTVVRAELQAVLEACVSGWKHQCRFSIWCDSQIVVDKVKQMQRQPHMYWPNKTKNHDLFNAIANVISQCGTLLATVNKVCSHQDEAFITNDVDAWCFLSNDHADSVASQAFRNQPQLMQQQQQAKQAIMHARALRDALHKQLITLGLNCLTQIQRMQNIEQQPTPAFIPTPVEMVEWKIDPDLPCPAHFQIDTYDEIVKWNASLHDPTGVPQMWSWWELYADACQAIPCFSPTYDARKQVWYNDPAPTVPFLKRAKSFARYLGKLSHKINLELPTKHSNPQSAHIAFWTKCLPVQVPLARHAIVDTFFGRHVTGARKTSDLSALP